MNILQFLKPMKQPKSYIQEVLYELITKKSVQSTDFHWISDVPKYISMLTLDHDLIIDKELKHKINRYGNAYTYKMYSLRDKHKGMAVYKKITRWI
jgi:hypothetical protein